MHEQYRDEWIPDRVPTAGVAHRSHRPNHGVVRHIGIRLGGQVCVAHGSQLRPDRAAHVDRRAKCDGVHEHSHYPLPGRVVSAQYRCADDEVAGGSVLRQYSGQGDVREVEERG